MMNSWTKDPFNTLFLVPPTVYSQSSCERNPLKMPTSIMLKELCWLPIMCRTIKWEEFQHVTTLPGLIPCAMTSSPTTLRLLTLYQPYWSPSNPLGLWISHSLCLKQDFFTWALQVSVQILPSYGPTPYHFTKHSPPPTFTYYFLLSSWKYYLTSMILPVSSLRIYMPCSKGCSFVLFFFPDKYFPSSKQNAGHSVNIYRMNLECWMKTKNCIPTSKQVKMDHGRGNWDQRFSL